MRPGKPGNIGKRASIPEMQINDIYPVFQQTQLMQYINIQNGIILAIGASLADFPPGVKYLLNEWGKYFWRAGVVKLSISSSARFFPFTALIKVKERPSAPRRSEIAFLRAWVCSRAIT